MNAAFNMSKRIVIEVVIPVFRSKCASHDAYLIEIYALRGQRIRNAIRNDNPHRLISTISEVHGPCRSLNDNVVVATAFNNWRCYDALLSVLKKHGGSLKSV